MPYLKLTKKMTKFSDRRIRQLFDDARIFAAHYADLMRGEKHHWKDSGKEMTEPGLINRFAKVKGLLWALGYEPKRTSDNKWYKRLYKFALPQIKKYYRNYKGRVKKT